VSATSTALTGGVRLRSGALCRDRRRVGASAILKDFHRYRFAATSRTSTLQESGSHQAIRPRVEITLVGDSARVREGGVLNR